MRFVVRLEVVTLVPRDGQAESQVSKLSGLAEQLVAVKVVFRVPEYGRCMQERSHVVFLNFPVRKGFCCHVVPMQGLFFFSEAN